MSVTSHPKSGAFTEAVEQFGRMNWRAEISVEEIGSPQRIAPYSLAIQAEFTEDGETLADGRLILLHDPGWNDSWDGTFRIVSFARADMDLDMVADPMLPDVAWSWMHDALEDHRATYQRLAGTVTALYSKSFGEMEGTDDQADVEIRSSWTPSLGSEDPLLGHLRAWQDLLGHVAGRPSLPQGIVQFPGAHT